MRRFSSERPGTSRHSPAPIAIAMGIGRCRPLALPPPIICIMCSCSLAVAAIVPPSPNIIDSPGIGIGTGTPAGDALASCPVDAGSLADVEAWLRLGLGLESASRDAFSAALSALADEDNVEGAVGARASHGRKM